MTLTIHSNNQTIKPLLIRPHIEPNESITGYVLRLAENNGYPSMHVMLSYAGLDEVTLRTNTPPFNVINQLIDRDLHSQLHPITNKDENTKVFHAYEIPAPYLNKKNPKICPECIASNRSVSLLFDLKLYVGCSIHKKYNITKCSFCHSDVNWNRPGVLICKCNNQYRPSEVQLPPPIAAIMALIEWKLTSAQTPSQILFDHCYPMEILQDLSPLMILNIALRIQQRPFLHMLNSQHEDSTLRSLEALHHMMHNWPNGFYQYLEEHQDNKSHSLTIRFQTFFKAFCSKHVNNVLIDFLHTEFIRFGNYYWKKSSIDIRYQTRTNIEGEVYGINGLAKRLNLRVPTILNFIRSGLIKGHEIEDDQGKRTIFYLSELPFKPWDGAIYDQRAAADYIGVSTYILRKLVSNKIFKREYLAHGTRGFAQIDLDNFIRAVTSTGPNIQNRGLGKPISFKHILAKHFQKNDFVITFFEATIAKTISPISGDSISTLMIDTNDLNKFCLEHGYSIYEEPVNQNLTLF